MDARTDLFEDKELLYEQVAGRVRRLIEQGAYRPGERIPSVRALSRQQDVSISTVLQAYLVLENQGLIEARPQSGYYVSQPTEGQLPEPEISSPGPDPSRVSLNELVMMILHDSQNPNLAQLGAALPNPELLATAGINHILASLARHAPQEAHQYQFPPGLEALRIQIARRASAAGCSYSPNEVIITSGGSEALNLCLYAVCRSGDIVAVESPKN